MDHAQWFASKPRSSYVPWDADKDWQHVHYTVTQGLKAVSSKDSYFAEFFQLSAAILVYHANRLEQAIGPTVIEGETYVLIKGFCDGSRPPPTPRSWDAEGGREDTLASSDRQLWQFLRAARYLCEEHVHDDLSIELLCETHRLMMEGSISYGQPTASGLRTQLAKAGYYVFVAPQYIDRALQGILGLGLGLGLGLVYGIRATDGFWVYGTRQKFSTFFLPLGCLCSLLATGSAGIDDASGM
jgi:hypothetical protein